MGKEHAILSGLILNEDYSRKVLPYIRPEYFDDPNDRRIFTIITDFINEYNELPSKDALKVEVDNLKNITDDQFETSIKIIDSLEDKGYKSEWLIDQTEAFCKERALHGAILKAAGMIDDEKSDRGSIPDMLSEALAVSFDTSVGHDYLEDAESRFEFYHEKHTRIEFDLELFNKITKGGLPEKSLTVLVAPTGVGKTLFMTDFAASAIRNGKKVLYITLEMAEERISERIDAKLMDMEVDDVHTMSRTAFMKRIKRMKDNYVGKIIVKEYPTGSASVNHFRHLLNELRMKKNFTPDIIFIDYLNICASSRVSASGANSYSVVKAITEEVRGLSMEYGPPVFSCTQMNRSGYSDSDADLTNMSDSFGIAFTADFSFSLYTNDEFEEQGQLMVKQLKNRWGSITDPRRFMIGVNRGKMTLYDLEDSAQKNILGGPKDDDPVFDKTSNHEDFNHFKKRKLSFEGLD